MTHVGGEPMDYRSAGVDIDAADDAKLRLAKLVNSTLTAGARGVFGGFGGMFRVPSGYHAPLLVASADGVGTKIKVAITRQPNTCANTCCAGRLRCSSVFFVARRCLCRFCWCILPSCRCSSTRLTVC